MISKMLIWCFFFKRPSERGEVIGRRNNEGKRESGRREGVVTGIKTEREFGWQSRSVDQ